MRRRQAATVLFAALLAGVTQGAQTFTPAPAVQHQDGYWVWTRTDAARFANAASPGIAGVRIASLELSADGSVNRRRGLSPAGIDASVAAVIRLEDSMQQGFRLRFAKAFLQQLDEQIALSVSEAEATGSKIAEVQLDYDAPESQLPSWAGAVRFLARNSLAGRALWVTSIPSHLRHRSYAEELRGVVQGHMIQLFDTGLLCTDSNVQSLSERLDAFGLAFRIGVGAFERSRYGATQTQHACWISAACGLSTQRAFGGLWVFPGGQPTERAYALWGKGS